MPLGLVDSGADLVAPPPTTGNAAIDDHAAIQFPTQDLSYARRRPEVPRASNTLSVQLLGDLRQPATVARHREDALDDEGLGFVDNARHRLLRRRALVAVAEHLAARDIAVLGALAEGIGDPLSRL